ncbi:MAG: hypothetical protein ACXW27_09730 [Allosphingosinicella sp.]
MSGFYRRSGSSTEHISNLNPDHVSTIAVPIKAGLRPVLGVYWSPHAPGDSKFVCSDDEIALAAYRLLGISKVPVLIYRPSTSALPEAAIWCEKRGEDIRLAGSVPSSRSDAEMVFGTNDPPIDLLINSLSERCQQVRSQILQFHQETADGTHYHHVLHATLKRHERLLDSIRVLVSSGRIEHAEGLLRIGYEAFLNFYLDWLSPGFFGPRLQLLSAVRHAEIDEQDPKNLASLKGSLAVLQNFTKLLETTAEKARLSPLGTVVHSLLYPPLSLVSHQTYGNVESEADSFHDAPTKNSETRTRQLGRWLDAITTAMVLRIRDDTGGATP